MVVYSEDKTAALELGEETKTKKGMDALLITARLAITTPIISPDGARVVIRLWPKGNDFVNEATQKGFIAKYLVPQLFPNTYNGTLKEFEKEFHPEHFSIFNI
jgi:hypothetical protein